MTTVRGNLVTHIRSLLDLFYDSTDICICRDDTDLFLARKCFAAGDGSSAVQAEGYGRTYCAVERLSRESRPYQLLGYLVSTMPRGNARADKAPT